MRKVLILMLVFLFIAVNLYAAGDLIVEGNVGIGTTAPVSKFEVVLEGAGAAGSFTKYINGVSGAFPMIKKARGTAAAPL
ncbi:MAG: hypothetical protein HY752_08510, partial [Nitrospirae bacterium]|nr:hypothetical protein [Nitrospirota bacterium]